MVEPVLPEAQEPVPSEPSQPAPGPLEPTPRRRPGRPVLLVVVLIAVGILISGLLIVRGGPAPPTSAGPSAPAIAVVDRLGSLSVVERDGHAAVVAGAADVDFGFPAWSPDGTRIAAVSGSTDGTSISIFTAHPAGDRPSPSPAVIYRSSTSPPFYLAWAPDGRNVSFLATEPGGLSLRIAPADGSAPLDGSGPGGIVHRGAPLYFDWIGTDRLLLHVGTGTDAFLGEVGLDGAVAGPTLGKPGDFRPAVVSQDRKYLAFVRVAPDGSEQLVVAARDGSAEHAQPVFGVAAVLFDPSADRIASIAADRPGQTTLAFPIGPLRVTDAASGASRVLLDGSVVAFFWSPDGRTIAALRLEPAGGGSTAAAQPPIANAAARGAGLAGIDLAAAVDASATPSLAPSASTEPGSTGAIEVRLVFVDTGTGAIRSQRVVRPASRFVNELLPYFDQYALSHRLWAPDGSSLLLPVVDDAGATHVVAFRPDGGEPELTIDGEIGFWSP